MAVNEVIYDGETLISLTSDTVTAETLAEGVTAHDASGEQIVGVAPTTAVRYTAQSLTDAQQKQARTNVNAAAKETGIFYIEGSGSTAGTWLGSHDDITELYDGLTIAYKIAIAGASTTTLNINSLGAKTVRKATSKMTTHLPVGTVVHLTYTTISGTGYWVWADYDSGNTKVTQAQSSTATGKHPVLLSYYTQDKTTTTAQTVRRDNNFYYQPSTGTLTVENIVSPSTLGRVSVTVYGAVGDGSTDDTTAFQNALAENRVVFVPGGTYKLSGELVIDDNCGLELAQDVVLNFTQTSGNCISLNRSAFLKGNHATLKVPYAFTGNAINVDTSVHSATKDVLPWTHWDPQWKTARYITDLNICKPNGAGLNASNSGDFNGTAVFIKADKFWNTELEEPAYTYYFIWGLNFSGLRIAGAFEYGIKAISYGSAYNHEMRIEAFIDAAYIGVSLEDCNNAFISAIVQPRHATNDPEYTPYAKHGIELINCENTDLTGSRVWDWNDKKSLWTYDKSNINQHIAMYGNCFGTIMNDYNYHYLPSGFNDIRELIYCEEAYKDINFSTLIVLQEPITRWFKPVDDEPYFNNGVDGDQRLVLKAEQDALFQTNYVPTFTDVLSKAGDGAGAVFNEIGYMHGYTWAYDGAPLNTDPWGTCTGYIPCSAGDIIRVDGMFMNDDSCSEARVILFNSNYEKTYHVNRDYVVTNGSYYNIDSYTETDNGFSFRIVRAGTAFIKINVAQGSVANKPAISINEEIGYTQVGTLADGISIKEESLIGMEKYERTGRMVTAISSGSTDEQYPSAKAVYSLVSSAIGAAIGGSY